ncbi:T9SS type A sorting domain-containing protein [Empedobacter brevis]|uniref:T9SS type A sorting domain-containing protein n=1 Tax=Empedobacter brevis TaxID=247 RepID=UPI00123E2C3F|nr:T9SS type A sorting domain-containing protein [Empedobacter brevis]QES93958.1 T9SS type A sorting domain-containing protein [Empedobacter brevis]
MRKKLLLLWSFLGPFAFSQQISLDTSLVSDIPNTIDEWWYWSGGFPVIGNGFSANTDISVRAIDPNGKPWRDFTGKTDGNGNFSIQISAKKINSIYGDYTIEATDKNNVKATAILKVTKKASDVIDVAIEPNTVSLSNFFIQKLKLKAYGFEPNAEVRIIAFSPNEVGSQLEPEPPYSNFDIKYADENGNFEFDFNGNTISYPWGDSMPPVPGEWRIGLNGHLTKNTSGSSNFRVTPENPSPNNYCTIEHILNATQTNKVTPITSFEIEGVNINNSDPNTTIYYEDFTNTIFDLKAGQTYKGILKGINKSTFSGDTFTLFFDWNQNGILDEENEIIHEAYLLGDSNTSEIKTSEFMFKVPENALNGNTRLRILKVSSVNNMSLYWPIGSCGYYMNNGQVEDYTIAITNGITPPNCTLNCPDDITVKATEGVDNAIVNYDLDFGCDTVNGTCETSYLGNNYSYTSTVLPTVANDFDIEEGKIVKLTSIEANISRALYTSNATISIYKNNNGVPGEIIKKFEGVEYKNREEVGSIGGFPIYKSSFDLPEPIELTGGKYWLGLNIQGPLIGWETTSNVTTNPTYTSSNNGSTWEKVEDQDGVFKVIYECQLDISNDTEVILVSGLESGSKFPVGNTVVTHNLVYKGVVIDTCSFTVTVNETTMNVDEVNKNKIVVFPNPVTDVLNLSYDKIINEVSVFDVTGKNVFHKNIKAKTSKINLSKLVSGVYIVKAETIDGDIKTFKIIKK